MNMITDDDTLGNDRNEMTDGRDDPNKGPFDRAEVFFFKKTDAVTGKTVDIAKGPATPVRDLSTVAPPVARRAPC